jgi:hypothetical protein
LGEVIEDLNKTKSATVSLDASNKKDIKLFPIVVQYFLPNCGYQDKIIGFISLPGETSNLQCAMLKEVTNLPYKPKLLLCVQITQMPVLVVAKHLAKIMCGEI